MLPGVGGNSPLPKRAGGGTGSKLPARPLPKAPSPRGGPAQPKAHDEDEKGPGKPPPKAPLKSPPGAPPPRAKVPSRLGGDERPGAKAQLGEAAAKLGAAAAKLGETAPPRERDEAAERDRRAERPAEPPEPAPPPLDADGVPPPPEPPTAAAEGAAGDPPAGTEEPPSLPPTDVPPALADALREDQVSSAQEEHRGSPSPAPSSRRLLHVEAQRQVGSCELFLEIAKGGMATVHLGRWLGAGGFVKTVAVKALHPQFSGDPEFVKMFLDEARVVARIRHPNVMPIIDLVEDAGDLFIVMEYVHGVTLSQLLRQVQRSGTEVPIGVSLRVMTGALHGLHAAHEAKDPTGRPMELIHRDISPENIMVGADGYARLIDFGIASALGRATNTQDGQVKGKPSYLAPEQILSEPLDRRTDVYAASVVLWQALTGRKLIGGKDLGSVTMKILSAEHDAPSVYRPDVPPELDAIVLQGMAAERDDRYPDAETMAEALEKLGGLASHREVGRFVEATMTTRLKKAQKVLRAVEAAPVTEDLDEEELQAPLSVRRANAPFPDTMAGYDSDAGELSLGTTAPRTAGGGADDGRRKGLIAGGVAVAAAAVIGLVVGLSDGGDAEAPPTTQPTPPAEASTMKEPSPPVDAPAPEPVVDPTDPEPAASASASAAPSASASPAAPPAATTEGGKAPAPPPSSAPRPRLPTGI